MARQARTADQIRDAIQAMIDGARLEDPCNVCCAPTPIRLREPDRAGCNWTVNVIPHCPAPCAMLIEGFIARAMERYNLR